MAEEADDKQVIDDGQNNDVSELSLAEQDALDSISDGVKGSLTENETVDDILGSKKEVDDGGTEDTNDVSDAADGDAGDSGEKGSDESSAENQEGSDEENEAAGDGDGEDKQQTSESNTRQEVPAVQEAAKSPVENPGDFKPNDYSFTITTTDGKTHQITSVEDAENLAKTIDEDPTLITASEFMVLNRKTSAMEQGITSDKKAWEAEKAAWDEQVAIETTREETIKQWDSELKYLSTNGDIPSISDTLTNADWSDPTVAADPAVKARLDILQWMEGENTKRISAGLEPMRSLIDAHNAMQLEAMRKQATDEDKQDKQIRQEKGSKIGGKTSQQQSNVPKDSIVGTGGSLDDLITDFYYNEQ